MQPILGRTWLEWIRLSRIFRAPFANLSLEIVKKMSRYYLLSGLSRIFRKRFANVYISRKVPFAQTSQIYACGPRLYKTFHGFLHDSHLLARAHHQAQAITPNSPPDPSLERQATRARQLVHLGELSAARQALTAGPLAPGTAETLQELRDPTRRPNEPYAPLHPSISELQPDQPVHLPDDLIIMNLRRARKGAAPGLSGLTTDTLRILLDDDTATTNLIRVARHFAQASIPAEIARAIGLGRMVALTKPNGRVRGIVVGDVLRRLVSRCLAQKYVQPIHTACQPHQFALATRSGTEAVVHALTAVTEANPTHTILSVDGVGAYDNISRNSMLQGLRDVPGFSYSAPATVSGRPRSHMRIHPGYPGILVIMGRFITSPPHPTSPVCSSNLGTPPTPFSGYPQHPSSSSCSPSA